MSYNTQFNNLEQLPATSWRIVSGPTVNPNAPSGFNFEQLPSGVMKFTIIGANYAGELAAVTVPVPPSPTGIFTLAFNLVVDDAASLMAQALEFDLIVSIGGWHYNGSFQVNYAEGGECQIVNAAGAWVDTGFKPGLFPAGQKVPVVITCHVDQVKKIMSVLTINVGGNAFTVPTTLQNIPATQLNWTDGVTVQVQCDVNDVLAGGQEAFSHEMDGICVGVA